MCCGLRASPDKKLFIRTVIEDLFLIPTSTAIHAGPNLDKALHLVSPHLVTCELVCFLGQLNNNLKPFYVDSSLLVFLNLVGYVQQKQFSVELPQTNVK